MRPLVAGLAILLIVLPAPAWGELGNATGRGVEVAFDATWRGTEVRANGGSELDLAAGVSNVFDQRTGAPGSVWVRLGVRLP